MTAASCFLLDGGRVSVLLVSLDFDLLVVFLAVVDFDLVVAVAVAADPVFSLLLSEDLDLVLVKVFRRRGEELLSLRGISPSVRGMSPSKAFAFVDVVLVRVLVWVDDFLEVLFFLDGGALSTVLLVVDFLVRGDGLSRVLHPEGSKYFPPAGDFSTFLVANDFVGLLILGGDDALSSRAALTFALRFSLASFIGEDATLSFSSSVDSSKGRLLPSMEERIPLPFELDGGEVLRGAGDKQLPVVVWSFCLATTIGEAGRVSSRFLA